jgi:phage-related protein
MITLPAALILEKNKVAASSPFLILLEIDIDDQILYLARNTENVIYGGHTYIAFPFEIEATKQVSKGEIPSTSVKVCNVDQVMQFYIESLDGLIGDSITILIVSKGGTGSFLLAASLTYDITGCAADSLWVTWTLGAPNPLFKRFPLYRYIANHCNWVSRFNTAINPECGYSGSEGTLCDGSRARCQQLGRSSNYGGFPGMAKGNVRLV